MSKKDNLPKKKRRTLYELFFKRFFDFLIALLALIVLSPVLLIVSIIQLFTVKKVIFAQYRPGRNGKIFKLYKFQSMKDKRDANGELLPDAERLTKFGKFLRKTGIDELPQLVNILKGDMSIVGPRPRLVKDMIFYDKEVIDAYTCRPGITCLSQISGGRSEASWEDIFEKDKLYAERITLWGDIKILFKTVFAVFKKEGQGGSAGDSKREYYYPDYLLKTGKITEDQYNTGLNKAKEIIKEKGTIMYQQDLHNEGNTNEQHSN